MPIKKTRPERTSVPGIFRIGPGRYLVRARWTDQRTGRRRKKEAVAATLAEAKRLKVKLMSGKTPSQRPSRRRFAAYAVQWMKTHGDRLSPSTRYRYVDALAHATVYFGQYFVDAILPSDVRDWIANVSKKAAPASVNGWLRVLRQALDDAVEDSVLASNPARKVKSIPEKRTGGKRGTALSIEEFRRMLMAIENLAGSEISEDVARFMLAVAWTGMRMGEVLAMKWSDFVDGEIHVTRSVWRRREKSTKTDDPRRITVVRPLAEVLEEQRRWLISTQHPGLSSSLMFPASPKHAKLGASRRNVDELSWYRSQNILKKPLDKVVAAAKIPPISPHSFRRTWENILRQAGVEDLVRRAIAGWRTDKAQAIYATVDREERDAAAEAVVRLVMKSSG